MNVYEAAALAFRTGRPAALATLLGTRGSSPRSVGSKMLVFGDGELVGTIGGGAFEAAVIAVAREVVASGAPRRYAANLTRDLGMCCGGEVEVWVEPVPVRERFVVFGAGHVSHALAPMLEALDFNVTIVDDRDEWLNAARFPHAERLLKDPRDHARGLAPDPRSWWLVMTHDHGYDQEIVEALLPRSSRWLGMIGSRTKVARFKLRFRSAGLADDVVARLRAPVGLDLGAETPQEIAVAIAAEVVQLRRSPRAGP